MKTLITPIKLKAECVIYDKDNPRRLLQFRENNDGTVIIKNNPGTQVGLPPHNRIISEHRYSIHPSFETDLPFSTIKSHLIFEDRSFLPPAYLYTSAIKSLEGFTNIFSIRYSDLKISSNDLKKLKPAYELISLGNFDSASEFLNLSIYVGHRDSKFEVKISNFFSITELKSTYLKIIILTSVTSLPAIPFSNFINNVTHGDAIPSSVRSINGGVSVESCISYYNHCLKMSQLTYQSILREQLEESFYTELEQLMLFKPYFVEIRPSKSNWPYNYYCSSVAPPYKLQKSESH